MSKTNIEHKLPFLNKADF